MEDQQFFITTMPSSRPADYYLGYREGSVFFDFNNCGDKIALIRISFDGYSCYAFEADSIPLNQEESTVFRQIISQEKIDQDQLLKLVTKVIALNKDSISADALKEYGLD